MAKLDLADAFKHIMVQPADWPLLYSSWDTVQADGSVLRQYYVDLFLPFGLRSSPAIFNHYADVLEFTMWANGVQDLLHYLDDYFMQALLTQGNVSTTLIPWCMYAGTWGSRSIPQRLPPLLLSPIS